MRPVLRVGTAAFEPVGSACSLTQRQLGVTARCPKPGVEHELLHSILTSADVPYRVKMMKYSDSGIESRFVEDTRSR